MSKQTDTSSAATEREKALEAALIRVLEWPLPNGTVETWALPAWLAKIAREALSDV